MILKNAKTQALETENQSLREMLEKLRQENTHLKKTERALGKSQERLQLALDGTGVGVWAINLKTGFSEINKNWGSIMGYGPDEIGSDFLSLRELVHPADKERVSSVFEKCEKTGKNSFEVEYRLRTKKGRWRWFVDRGRIVKWDNEGKVVRVVGTSQDITSSKTSEEKIKKLALHDPLTKLPNRRLLEELYRKEKATARRNRSKIALIFADLDGFKVINDTFGHETGDHLLCEVANRIENCVRRADTVVRLGGDEFVILMVDFRTLAEVENVAKRIIAEVSKTHFDIESNLDLGVSLGIAFYPNHGNKLDELIRMADNAMYQVKCEGKNNYRLCAHF